MLLRMAKARQKRSDQELRALSHHLLYEIEMFVETTTQLRAFFIGESSYPVRALRNSLLESWALHVRNLLSFLYDDRAGVEDAIAADFLDVDWATERGAKPEVLRASHKKASKEIAHLSYHRIGLTDDQRGWTIEPIFSEMVKAIRKFINLVPESHVQKGFRERANAVLPQPEVVTSAGGLSVASTSLVTPAQLKGPLLSQ
jgi:hypothetical protein